MSLSDKIENTGIGKAIFVSDVKEFIKKIKKRLRNSKSMFEVSPDITWTDKYVNIVEIILKEEAGPKLVER